VAKEPGSLEVRRAVERGSIPPVWLWAGPEDYLKEELFRILAAKLVDDGMASLNVNRFRGGDDGIEAILIACQTLPMFSARRAIHLRDVEGLNRGDRDRLLAYVARPCPETALVLSAEAGADSFASAFSRARSRPF
jgi:DNA polymerase-3 subunit delta